MPLQVCRGNFFALFLRNLSKFIRDLRIGSLFAANKVELCARSLSNARDGILGVSTRFDRVFRQLSRISARTRVLSDFVGASVRGDDRTARPRVSISRAIDALRQDRTGFDARVALYCMGRRTL